MFGTRSISRSAIAALLTISSALVAACGSDEATSLATSATPATALPTTTPALAEASDAPTTTEAASATNVPPTVTEVSTTGAEVSRSDEPTTTAVVQETTTLPAPPVTDAAPAAPIRPIVVVDGSGGARVVQLDGSSVLLHDGSDPDDEVTEGPRVLTAGVAVTQDQSVTFVGTCCEPSPGTMFTTINGVEQTSVGHEPAVSPDQTKVAYVTFGSISVASIDLGGRVSVEVAGTGGFTPEATDGIEDVMWVDDAHLVVLTVEQDVTAAMVHGYELVGDSLVSTSAMTIPVANAFAGTSAGSSVIYTFDGSATLRAYDAATLQPVADLDIQVPGDPISAFTQNGELRWVGADRSLHVGDAVVPGEYVWVH